jgi:hypothetical protein
MPISLSHEIFHAYVTTTHLNFLFFVVAALWVLLPNSCSISQVLLLLEVLLTPFRPSCLRVFPALLLLLLLLLGVSPVIRSLSPPTPPPALPLLLLLFRLLHSRRRFLRTCSTPTTAPSCDTSGIHTIAVTVPAELSSRPRPRWPLVSPPSLSLVSLVSLPLALVVLLAYIIDLSSFNSIDFCSPPLPLIASTPLLVPPSLLALLAIVLLRVPLSPPPSSSSLLSTQSQGRWYR